MHSTLMFVLRWHFMEFVSGLGLLVLGILGYVQYTPGPPDAAYQSLVGMFGPWPYIVCAFVGALLAALAWQKGGKLRNC